MNLDIHTCRHYERKFSAKRSRKEALLDVKGDIAKLKLIAEQNNHQPLTIYKIRENAQ